MKALMVGRHAGSIPCIEVIETRPVQFPATADECVYTLVSLMKECEQNNWGLLFQAIPGQLAIALSRMVKYQPIPVGVVISKPGPRPAGARVDIPVSDGNMFSNKLEVITAIRALNPNAKIDESKPGWITVTVDPPMRFEFSHIEWL